MNVLQQELSRAFKEFFDSGRATGFLLIACTLFSLVAANSAIGERYLSFWQMSGGGLSLELWINDALMAIFFLLIGLELQREFQVGELADRRNAALPIFAALGGICVPATIHFAFNRGAQTQAGMGIPMATDIAFSLGVLSLLGNRVPASLKLFLTAVAVIDDLGAILVIAVFYTAKVSLAYLIGAMAVLGVLAALNRLRVMSLIPYLLGGSLMWVLLHGSGVHATMAGVLTAFTIPFARRERSETSPLERLEHFLQRPVALVILPIFALANTGIVIDAGRFEGLLSPNSVGIFSGLTLGKPIGITLASFLVVRMGICRLPGDLNWKHVFGAGLLGGIGFTMSIFIANLAFPGEPDLTSTSRFAVLLASATAGAAGLLWLRLSAKDPQDFKAFG
jgi:NhaA family Na+:H+ antiporter